MSQLIQVGGEKEMHVRSTMLASHDKLWISLLFRVEICETVFIIIMKIVMIIIMMVIKEKKKTHNHKCYTPTTHADTP